MCFPADEVNSSNQRFLKSFLFLGLPLLCGVAAYGHARMAERGSAAAQGPGSGRETREVRGAPKFKDVEAALYAASERANAAGPPDEAAEEKPQDPAALRKALLEDAVKNGNPDGNERRDGFNFNDSADLVTALVKLEGKAGVEWIESNLPVVYALTAMNAWADLDMDAAFDHVTTSHRRPPCSPSLVSRLLDHKAEAGPEALREAAAKIPWENLPLGETRDGELALMPDTLYLYNVEHFAAWRDSGVLRTLAKQGVQFGDIFDSWSALDADEAVREWAIWPNLSGQDADYAFRCMVENGSSDWSEETVARLAGLLKNADQPTHERIVDWMRRFPDERKLKDQEPAFRELLEKEGGS
ncbi:MAG: hypothetical protein JWO82_3060 [Akkermansiaceae bacterium]|nr:hypothetical protein [Akkermansiaceae bacterium]